MTVTNNIRSKAITVLSLLSLALSGCTTISTELNCDAYGTPVPPTESIKGGAVVLFQGSVDFPDAGVALRQNTEFKAALPKTKDEVPFTFGLAVADGAPNLVFQSWVDLREGDAKEELQRKNRNAQATLGSVYDCAFQDTKRFGSFEDNVDLVGGLRTAAGALSDANGSKLIVVFSNGIQTSGKPNFGDDFPDSIEAADAILDQLEAANALPNLSGTKVEWFGLGQQTAGSISIEQQTYNTLEHFWRNLILRSGGVPPADFATGALGSEAKPGSASSLPLAPIRGVCLFTLDETRGFEFKPDSADFVSVSGAQAGAEYLAALIRESGCGQTSLRVTGYTASGKDKEKFEADGPNYNLSKLRAEAFADLLTSLGLNVEEAIGGGKGPTVDWDGDGKFDPELGKLNRIVVVEEIR